MLSRADLILRPGLRGRVATTGSTPATTVTVGRNQKGVQITANNQLVDNVTFNGPGADIFGGAYGVYGVGSYTGVVIRNCTFHDFDHTAIWLDGLVDPLIENCFIYDTTYTGIMLLGVTKGTGTWGGRVLDNTIVRVGKDAHQTPDFNAYGIAVTMNGGGTPSSDTLVQDNLVTDIPLWHGIDTHGGQRILIAHNEIRRTARGIFITANLTTERATDVSVVSNLVTEPQTATGGTDANTAITTYDCRGTTSITNNVVGTAYPNIHNDSGSLSSPAPTLSGNVRGETLPSYP